MTITHSSIQVQEGKVKQYCAKRMFNRRILVNKIPGINLRQALELQQQFLDPNVQYPLVYPLKQQRVLYINVQQDLEIIMVTMQEHSQE